ncbi:uncharacterized protein PG986_014091 [Apiospora aurea]|uniref:Auxiliary Activity family 9 catalytic domain-containing protein n=1 Tax=Apiospora aurea TaxID=335848 RepID=A0ABR1PSB3_9PEZI
MGRFTSYAATLAATLAATASGHMIMKSPAPIGNPDNSPLSADGSNFPCKVTGDPATFYAKGETTKVKAGEKQTLSFTGSAVHGGGSCQLAITTDKAPTASTQWSVIQSIEGGCPSKDGSGPSEYEFEIPDSVPSGDYVFAWTWISKMSGAPEYYMNCAKLQVEGGGNKRSVGARAEEMPNLFVANLASVNTCKSRDGGSSVDVLFPNPGPNVVKPGSSNTFSKAIGDQCFPKGGTAQGVLAGAGGSSGGGDSAPAPAPSAPAVTSSAAASKPTAPGGVFVTMPQNGGGAAAPTSAPAASKPSTTAAAPAAPSAPASAPAAPAAPKPSAPSTPGAGAGSGSSQGAQSGKCTEEGQFNCVGQQFQQCASGSWTPLQAMAAGTKCAQGFSASLWVPSRRLRRGTRGAAL